MGGFSHVLFLLAARIPPACQAKCTLSCSQLPTALPSSLLVPQAPWWPSLLLPFGVSGPGAPVFCTRAATAGPSSQGHQMGKTKLGTLSR